MSQINKGETKRKEEELYYIEGGYRVFTELYHRNRGFCCKQGCRHCPFEPKHQRNTKNLRKD